MTAYFVAALNKHGKRRRPNQTVHGYGVFRNGRSAVLVQAHMSDNKPDGQGLAIALYVANLARDDFNAGIA